MNEVNHPTNLPTCSADIDDLSPLARGFCNTPSQNIDISVYQKVKKYPFCLQIDWLSITFDFVKFEPNSYRVENDSLGYLNELISYIYPGKEFGDFELMESNRFGYKRRIVISEDINFYFFGPETSSGNSSSFLNISGNGMNKLTDSQLYSIFTFSKNPYHFGSITRLDPGFDNHSNICKLIDLKDKCDKNLYKSRSRCDIYYSGGADDVHGLTIYFGKGSSFSSRFYDKNAERMAKDPNFVREHKIWVRYELQSRDSIRNHQFVTMFCLAYEQGDMSIFARYVADVLAELVMFYEIEEYQTKGGVTKKRKVPFKEWMKLLDHYSGIKQRVAAKASVLLDKKIDWVNRSVFGSLAMIYIVYGKVIFEKWLYRAIGLNLINFDDLQRAIVNSKNNDLGVLEFDKEIFKKEGEKLIKEYEDLNGALKAFIKKEWEELKYEEDFLDK